MSDRSKYLYRKTAKGKPYIFFRHKGKLTPLPADESSVEFRRAYDAALCAMQGAAAASPSSSEPNKKAFLPDTIGAAIDVYLDSARFAATEPSSQNVYRNLLNNLRARLGAIRLADIDTDRVDIYTDKLVKECGVTVADRHLRMLSLIWQTCRKFPQFKIKGLANPTLEAERHYTEAKHKHRPWPQEVQDAFMKSAPDNLKLAKLLLHYSAQRGCDCIKMKWSDYDGKRIAVRARKTHGERAALPDYFICPRPLREALDTAPRVAETILVSARGTPYEGSHGLGNAIRVELKRLGLHGKTGKRYVMHGLRKTAASEVAELAVGAAGVKSVGGWKSDAEANYYAQHAEKQRINALVVEKWDAELDRQEALRTRRARIRVVD